MWSVVNAECYFDDESVFRELPESAQQALGDRLMPDSAWKLVADQLGFTAVDIETIAAVHTSHAAHHTLRRWSRLCGSTLRVLRQTLCDIRRRDIVTFLDDVCKRESTYNITTTFRKKRHPFYFYDNFVRCRPI